MRFSLLATILTVALAADDVYNLENGKMIQSCAYITTCDKWYERVFRRIYPGIRVYLFDAQNQPDYNIYVLQMSADDYKKVNLGIDPYYKICDELAFAAGLCDAVTAEEKATKKSLTEVIDNNEFSSPIHSVLFNPSRDDSLFYDVLDTGFYCTIIHTNEIPKDGENEQTYVLGVEWRQSFGHLLVSDFRRMYLAFLLTIGYGIYSIIYMFLTYKHIYSDKAIVFSVDSLKNKRFTFQYKIISFLVGMFLVQLMTLLDYIFQNSFMYSPEKFVVWFFGTLELIFDSLLNTWVVYNLILFSAGAWVLQSERYNMKFTFAKFTAISLLLQFLLHDFVSQSIFSLFDEGAQDIFSDLIFIQFIITLAVCLFWSMYTTYEITDLKIRRLYIQTIGIVGSVFSATLIFRFVDDTALGAHFISFIEFIAVIIFSLIWNNVFYESGKLVL